MKAAVLIYIPLLACFWSCSSTTADKAGGAPKKPNPPVSVYIVQTETSAQSIDATGTLLAEEEIILKPEIAGKITGIYFKEGDFVAKGKLLYKIQDIEIQAQLQKLQAQYNLAELTANRQKQLLAVQGVSQQDYDLTLNQLETIKADLALTKAQAEKTSIRAPFAGKIGLRNVSVGSYISPGTPLSSLQFSETLRLDFSVPERYANQIKTGSSVSFQIDGTETQYQAIIYAIEPLVDQSTRSIRIRARFQNKSQLFSGAFANVKIDLKENPSAILIPSEAIIPEARNKKVIRVKNGTAEFVIVKTGARDATRIQIESGLAPGDTIVTSGLMQLKPESPIQIGNIATSKQEKTN